MHEVYVRSRRSWISIYEGEMRIREAWLWSHGSEVDIHGRWLWTRQPRRGFSDTWLRSREGEVRIRDARMRSQLRKLRIWRAMRADSENPHADSHRVDVDSRSDDRVPRYQRDMLSYFAKRDGRSLDTVLARELDDLAAAHSEELAARVPGFKAAMAWPSI